MFEKLQGKYVKVVWRDLNAEGQNKAIKGTLKDINDPFVLVIQNSKPIYININHIVAVKEYEQED